MQLNDGKITITEPNEIFVFGSNKLGHHTGGAANYAMKHHGAIYRQGHGLQGKSYAIDTMSTYDEMVKAIELFIQDACKNPNLTFIVTPIGCGIAGYTPDHIAPLFRLVPLPSNIILPAEFKEVLK